MLKKELERELLMLESENQKLKENLPVTNGEIQKVIREAIRSNLKISLDQTTVFGPEEILILKVQYGALVLFEERVTLPVAE